MANEITSAELRSKKTPEKVGETAKIDESKKNLVYPVEFLKDGSIILNAKGCSIKFGGKDGVKSANLPLPLVVKARALNDAAPSKAQRPFDIKEGILE